MQSTKVIDIFNSLHFTSDYNSNGTSTGSDLITISQYGILTLNNTQSSINSNTASLVIPNGSLSINSGFNSTSITQGGSLSVKGGAAFGKDLYIGGNLSVLGNISGTSNTFTYLTIKATDSSINVTSGALISLGGVSIQASTNATSSTSGGGLTVNGGIATKQDLYVGGNAYLPNIISSNISSNNVNFSNITSNTLNVTTISAVNLIVSSSTFSNLLIKSSLDVIGNSNTIANIFTTSGNVGINTTSPAYQLDINGSLRVAGTSSSLNLIASNSPSDILQIQNTNASGASTLQFLNNYGSSTGTFGIGNSNTSLFQNTAYISTITGIPINLSAGGNTSFPVIVNSSDNSLSITSTTNCNDTSSGALKVSGGAGISGNLYVGGGLYVNSQIAVNITNTLVSSCSTIGAMLLSGGISINILNTSISNATSYTSGGGLTIAGGLAVSQNTYIGGILDIQSGSNNLNNVILQSIQFYSNSNNGSYSVIGSGNSTRTSHSFTPIRFTGWNDQNNPKLTINTNTIDIINSINATNTCNTIGNVFTTGGNVGINTTTPGFSLDVFGNINFTGLLYKNSNPYISSQWIGTNGTLLTYGSAGSSSFVGINTINPTFTLDVSGVVRITTSLTTGNIYSTNLTSTNIVGTFISSAGLYSTNSTITNLTCTNSSLGTINSSGLTTGNINFTGSLYQNSIPYIGSQWTSTSGNVSYTSGNVIISNELIINSSISTLNVGNLTSSNINFTGNLYQNGLLYSSTQWSNINPTSIYFGTSANTVTVSIGTTSEAYTLNVNGIISGTGLAISGTTNSLNSTTGQYVFNSISIPNTTQCTSYTQGGALTVAGGVGIGGNIAVAGSVNYGGSATDIGGSYSALNNMSTATDITNLIFPTINYRSFTLQLTVQIISTNSSNALYTINGIQTNSGWFIEDSFSGDYTGIVFTINNNTGQIQYTSTNISGWISTNFIYKATTFSISANYIPNVLSNSGNYAVGGTLTVASGVVANNIDITNSGTFSAVNGQSTPANITGLVFTNTVFSSFVIKMIVTLLKSDGNLKEFYTISGVQKSTGWVIYSNNVGDNIDLTFNITSLGQLQYSSQTTYVNFNSLVFNFNVDAFYITGAASTLVLSTGSSNNINKLSITSINDANNTSGAALSVAGGVSIGENTIIGLGLTVGNINSIGLTTGNINFTGYLYQNSIPYIGSQWTTTSGNLSYTSGNIIINNLTTGNINFTGSLYQNSIPYVGSQWTSTSGSGLSYTSGTVFITNSLITNITANNLQVSGTGSNISKDLLIGSSSYFTTSGSLGINTTTPNYNLDVNGTVHITNSLTTGSVYCTNITSNNIKSTSISTGSLNTGTFVMGNTKMYTYSGSINNTTNGNLVLSINTLNSYFYAKITSALQETSDPQNISILQFECAGAAGSIPNLWNIGMNSNNTYGWSTSITSGNSNTTANLQFVPSTSLRNYTYTIQIEMVGTASATILKQDNTVVNNWTY